MSDTSKIKEQFIELLPVKLEVFLSPMTSHRYYKNGKLRTMEDIRSNEQMWKNLTGPQLIKTKKSDPSLF